MNMELALIVLSAGIIIVFAVLVLLIFIIKIYSAIIAAAQKRSVAKKEGNQTEASQKVEVRAQAALQQQSEAMPEQIVAVIAAAVDAVYGQGACKIKSIKKIPQSRPVWSTAGLMENTRPF